MSFALKKRSEKVFFDFIKSLGEDELDLLTNDLGEMDDTEFTYQELEILASGNAGPKLMKKFCDSAKAGLSRTSQMLLAARQRSRRQIIEDPSKAAEKAYLRNRDHGDPIPAGIDMELFNMHKDFHESMAELDRDIMASLKF